jgi:hypothetical protein
MPDATLRETKPRVSKNEADGILFQSENLKNSVRSINSERKLKSASSVNSSVNSTNTVNSNQTVKAESLVKPTESMQRLQSMSKSNPVKEAASNSKGNNSGGNNSDNSNNKHSGGVGPNPYEEKFHSEFCFVSLILGIFGIIMPLFSVLAIIFGIGGLMQTHRERMKGKWMAIAGIFLGFLGILIIIVAIVMSINFLETYLTKFGGLEYLVGKLG